MRSSQMTQSREMSQGVKYLVLQLYCNRSGLENNKIEIWLLTNHASSERQLPSS